MFNRHFHFVLGLAVALLATVSACDLKKEVSAAKTKTENIFTNTAKGQELYLSYGCAVCHGKNGDGKGINAKRYYPPPTDFRDPDAYRHGNAKEEIIHTIKYGVRQADSGMPAFEHITEPELNQLSDFLLSLRQKE